MKIRIYKKICGYERNTILFITIIAFAYSLSGCAPRVAGISKNPEALSHYSKGTQALTDGGYKIAINELTQSVRIDPNSASTRLNLGAAYFYDGSYDLAIAELEQSMRINKKYAFTHFWLANAFYATSQFSGAANEYYEVMALFGGDFLELMPYPLYRALSLQRANKMKEAEKYLKRMKIGISLLCLGCWEKNIAKYMLEEIDETKLLEDTPSDKDKVPHVYFVIGVTNMMKGNKEMARTYLQKSQDTPDQLKWVKKLAAEELRHIK